jgi:pimeloyl-ACP methyl ester carboxylesterase
MLDHQIKSPDGRIISFSDFGNQDQIPVLWCHGGPGSRLEPQSEEAKANAAGLRLIGIDRPGYGASSPQPGRSICDWTADALAVADYLNIEQFFIVGTSTGGAYALATAAVAPERILGVIACCGVSDMRWGKDNAMLEGSAQKIWAETDREAVKEIVIQDFGEDGSKMVPASADDLSKMLAPPDLALFMDPEYLAAMANDVAFAQGVEGYVDDRSADAPINGWSSFNVNKVACPVIVVHGEADWIVPVAHAHHTAEIVAGAELRTFTEHGHLSVVAEVVSALQDLIK